HRDEVVSAYAGPNLRPGKIVRTGAVGLGPETIRRSTRRHTMTESTSPKGSSASRRDFLRSSTAATIGLGLLSNAHAAGSDAIKVGLIGCGGRGTGAAENICEAAGTSYNVKLYAMGDVFEDHLRNCRDSLKNDRHCKEKFDVADERCFVGFDAFQKVI